MGRIKHIITTTILLTLLTFSTRGQGIATVKGIVVDKGGDPLVGCNVMIKGTSTGVVTDICGEFSIAIGPDDFTIVFHDMTYEDLRVFEQGLKRNEITEDKIIFQIGSGKEYNKECKRTINKRLKKFRIK